MLTHKVYLHAGNVEVNFHQANLLLSFSFHPPEAKQFCSHGGGCWPCEGWAAGRGGHSPALLLQHGESVGLGAA